ncbi:MAG TPA: SRPBCC family protein [Micromonosporaceae bacterium]
MIIIERRGRIAAPTESVWEVVSDVRRLSGWFAGVNRAQLISGSGYGRRQRMYGRWGRQRFELDADVIAYRPPTLIAWWHVVERIEGRVAPRYARAVEVHVELTPDGDDATAIRLISVRRAPRGPLRAALLRLVHPHPAAEELERSIAALGARFLPAVS